MLQISASVVLPESCHIIENCAIGEDSGQSHTVRVKRVMPDELDATGVRGEVASDEAGAFGSEVKRHFVAADLCVVLDIAEDAASLGRDDTVALVEADDAVHALSVHDDLIVDRDRATNEASPATLRDDCKLARVAVFKDGADFLSCLRLQHEGRSALIFLCPVSVVNVKCFFVCYHALVANDSFEESNILRELQAHGQQRSGLILTCPERALYWVLLIAFCGLMSCLRTTCPSIVYELIKKGLRSEISFGLIYDYITDDDIKNRLFTSAYRDRIGSLSIHR